MSQNIPRPAYQTTILQPVNNPPPHATARYVPGPPINYNRPIPPGRSFHIRGDPRIIQRPPRPPQGQPRHPPHLKEVNDLISKEDLSRLAKDIDQSALLEDDVIEVLLKLSEEFVDNVVMGSCTLAKHRRSQTLEVGDVKLCLSQKYDLQIPGFSVEDSKHKKQHTGEAHKQRLALIRKQLKR
jgi:histone H3/H4